MSDQFLRRVDPDETALEPPFSSAVSEVGNREEIRVARCRIIDPRVRRRIVASNRRYNRQDLRLAVVHGLIPFDIYRTWIVLNVEQ